MKESYSPNYIEQIVQQYWDTHQTFAVTEDENKKKYYCVSMLPYPSGKLHMGHVRNYTIGDVISRYHRMLGENVLQPMGWDAFGLPAEQAAITNKVQPSQWTFDNIRYMKNQLKSLGFAYDWNRELITCQPQYYRWEQWFFTVLYKKGLVYRKTSLVNWCPYHKTVLANEQVIDNCCWRCQMLIEYKTIPQWFIKITDYADQLLQGLDQLQHWPEQVKTMQRNWIGRSEGIDVTFKIVNYDLIITIYTTQLNIFLEISHIIISIDHPIALKFAKNNPKLAHFINKHNTILRQSCKYNFKNYKKEGIFANIYAMHPITHRMIPVWIANFFMCLEAIDKTGAIACYSSHNQSDFEFANKYNIPIKQTIKHSDKRNIHESTQSMTYNQIISSQLHNDKKVNTDYTAQIIFKILIDYGIAQPKVSYRLKDWGVSRQRYWGTPIPMLTLKNGTFKPVPSNQLPVILPENVCIKENVDHVLKKNTNWIQTTYDGQIAFRDTDTFDTFIESAWYYVRYTCPHYHTGMIDFHAANYWLPIDQYIGGIEHSIMHLLYFRFYHKLMRDEGLVCSDEPAIRLLCQGMILADSFYYKSYDGRKIWISPNNVTVTRDKTGNITKAVDSKGRKLVYAGICKMSKSKNNGIDPNIMIQKYGADATRFFIMFAAPVDSALEWKESGIAGAQRFLKRIWSITYKHIQKGPVKTLCINQLNYQQQHIRCYVHNTIVKVTDDIDRRQSFNTALSAIMKLVKKLHQIPQNNVQDRAVLQEALLIIVRLLYPFTPHISFVLWKALGGSGNIDDSSWPIADVRAIQHEKMLIIVQINGKTKKKIYVPKNSDENFIYETAKKAIFLTNSLKKTCINKIIYIPKKIINFIIK